MANPYIERYWAQGAQDPAIDAFTINPSDSTDFTTFAKGIYVGTAGNITLITLLGTTQLFSNVPAGTVLPVQAKRVLLTGTTAGNMVGLV